MMVYIEIIAKLVVALSILNVWLVRSNRATPWRGGSAQNIKEEFTSYGLAIWFMRTIGTLKVLLSMALIASIWMEQVEIYSCIGIIALMLGAISMHVKIGDPIKKSIPAFIFLILTALIVWL